MALKKEANVGLAHGLAQNLLEVLSTVSWSFQYITPVPLSDARLAIRGFNQAELLARELVREAGLAHLDGVLLRRRHTPYQRLVAGSERVANQAGIFVVKEKLPGALSFLLVDDVYVTGATVNSASRALKKAGAQYVYVLTVARSLVSTAR